MPGTSLTPSSRAGAEPLRALAAARANTDALFAMIRSDSLYERPIPERHRIIFYVGHLEAFDWNLAGRYALDLPALHPSFDKLFSFGIDPPPGRLPEDVPADWPRLDEVHSYNCRVRAVLDDKLAGVPPQLLHVAIEHRLMHAETFAYMLHNLEYGRKHGPRERPAFHGPAPRPAMVEIPAGEVLLGLRPQDGFGWDNEFPAHPRAVTPFSLGKYKVTNGEYLKFVHQGAAAPHFWRYRSGKWFYRGMFREVPLPPGVAGLGHAPGGRGVRRLGGQAPAHRGRIPSRGIWNPRRRTFRAGCRPRQFRLRAMGSRPRARPGRERRRRGGHDRQRVGVDVHAASLPSPASRRSRFTPATRPTSSTASTSC